MVEEDGQVIFNAAHHCANDRRRPTSTSGQPPLPLRHATTGILPQLDRAWTWTLDSLTMSGRHARRTMQDEGRVFASTMRQCLLLSAHVTLPGSRQRGIRAACPHIQSYCVQSTHPLPAYGYSSTVDSC